jgi:hypothetical protein
MYDEHKPETKPSADLFLQALKDNDRRKSAVDLQRQPAKEIAEAKWLVERDRLIPERRDALMVLAPEVLRHEIETVSDEFWRDPRFEVFGWRGLDGIIEDTLCDYALAHECYLIASSTSMEVLENGALVTGNGSGGAIWYSTPMQRGRLWNRLDQVVGSGNFRICQNGGRVPIGVEDSDIEISVAVPLTSAAAEAMQKLRSAGEFCGQ